MAALGPFELANEEVLAVLGNGRAEAGYFKTVSSHESEISVQRFCTRFDGNKLQGDSILG